MPRTLTLRLATLAAAAWLALTPTRAEAQKALVYCPVGVDATGCNTIVAALTANAALFPDGVDAGYDGTSGTADLAGGDLSGYAVFVVPSLADGPDVQPYSLLRNGTIAGRIQAAFMGRVVAWSGTPDVGSTNRAAKDNLIRNLAAWAKPDAAGTHGPGVMVLQDNSDDPAGRYGWLAGISQMSIAGDNTLEVYSNVEVLNSTGQTILTGSNGLQIGYTNMASYGLIPGSGASSNATGGRTSRVVLATAAGEPAGDGIATVHTDKEDYAPGQTVTVTGAGWEPGETVTLKFYEDTVLNLNRTLSAVADESGNISNTQFVAQEQDLGVRFVLIATGETSGRTAQTTFTDGQMKVTATTGTTVTINWTKYDGAGSNDQCTAPVGGTGSGTRTVTGPTDGNTASIGSGESMQLTAPASATTPAGQVFRRWSVSGTTFSDNSTVSTANPVCVKGSSGSPTITAEYFPGTTLTVSSASGTYGGTATLNATLKRATDNAALSGKTVSFTLNGSPAGSAVTDASGVATIAAASLVGINAGTYATGVGTSFAGDATVGASTGTGQLTVSPRPITVTADAKTKIYGNADPVLTYQITSGTLVGTDAFTGALTRAAGEGVGTRAIQQGTLSLGINYAITFVGANLTITPRPVTVTADAKTKGYGDADPALTYQITSGSLAFSDAFSGALTRDPGETIAGSPYSIKQGTLALTTNYTLTFAGAALTITPRPITVTADAKTKVYGNADPALTYQITVGSLVGTDAFAGALSRAAGEPVAGSPYAITQGTLSLSSNYALTFVGANFTITTRPVTVTADAKTKVYGDPDPAFTYQLTSGTVIAGDVFSGTLSRAVGEGLGTRAIQLGTLTLGANYSITFISANLTITPRPIEVTADAGQTKIYGDPDPVLTYTVTSGSLAFSDAFTGSLGREAGEAVADSPYDITQGTLALSANYTLTFVGATFSITARPITLTADVKSKEYGNADPALTYQVTTGSLAFSDAFTGALVRAAGESVAGSPYAITQGTLALNANYTLTFVGANFTITPRPVTVTAEPKTKVYGNPDPALTYQLTSGTLVGGDGFTGALTRAAGEDAGTHAIQLGTLTLGQNYAITFVGANLTITPRPIEVTADAGQTKVYGEADPTFTYSITDGSLAFSDAFSGALSRAPGETVAGSPYAITQGTLTLGTNYDLSFVSADFTITTRPIMVTADAKSKIYGDDDPALTYQITSGSLAFSDGFTGSLTRAPGETVAGSPYAITQHTLALNANYVLTFVGANFTITARPVTVTADAKSKVYGEADPALTYQITSGNLVGGDGFSGALTRAAGETAGTHAIQQGTLALSPNYALTFVGADLTITPRPIEVTADAKTKVYGNPDPTLTYQITDGTLVGGDGFTGGLTREAGEGVGTRAIQQGTLTLGTNYDITFIGANLSITVRPVTVTADAGQSKHYGDPDPALTYQITSGSLAFSDAFSGSLARAPGETIAGGPYAITQGSLTLSGNYALTFVGASFAITQRPVTVTADAKGKVYGDPDPALTYQLTSGSLVTGDNFSGSPTRAAGEAVVGSPYAITQGSLALSPNYALTFVGANLTISARAIAVAADAKSKVYGFADPALTYQVTSGTLVSGDAFSGAITRAPGESVGGSPYAITQGTLALSSNYSLTFLGASFTVTPRPFAVAADPKTKVFGQPDPALTYQVVSGTLVAGDGFTGALTRAAGEAVGSYAINQGTLTLGGNYNLAYTPANLTIGSWTLTGFYQPVDMPVGGMILNSIKGGQTVPLKFEIFAGAVEKTDVSAVQSFVLLEVSCPTSSTIDDIELTSTGATVLRYDGPAGQFIQNWQTPKTVGKCYKVTMTAADAVSKLFAYFKTK